MARKSSRILLLSTRDACRHLHWRTCSRESHSSIVAGVSTAHAAVTHRRKPRGSSMKIAIDYRHAGGARGGVLVDIERTSAQSDVEL